MTGMLPTQWPAPSQVAASVQGLPSSQAVSVPGNDQAVAVREGSQTRHGLSGSESPAT